LGNLFEEKKQRKNFTIKTQKTEWLLASGNAKALEQYMKLSKFDESVTSKCRVCKTLLTWKSGKYEFDHKDNRNYNNSQSNCYLVCRNCHGEHTKVDKIKVNNPFSTEYKTVKRKIGYKKPVSKTKPASSKAKTPKKKTLKPTDADWWLT